MWYLNPAGTGSITFVGNFKTGYNNTTRPNVGPTSTAVMYNVGKILQVGGNGPTNGFQSPSSEFATTFDINSGTPVVTETAADGEPPAVGQRHRAAERPRRGHGRHALRRQR